MQILETIQKYYPLDIDPFTKEYDSSKEYKALIKTVLHNQEHTDFERSLFSNLEETLPSGLEINNTTKLQFLDRCFSFSIEKTGIEKTDQYSSIVICASILGPFYCIYERVTQNVKDNSGEFIGFIKDTRFASHAEEFPSKLIKDLKEVAEKIELREVPWNDYIKHCPGFSFNGIPKENFTVFNGLFKDEY